MLILKTFVVFVIAGLCEIGGGYLIWQWLREHKPVWYGMIGGIILALYGVVATFQPAHFGRVYATYGGVFILMSLLWGWKVDNSAPDQYDVIGATVALLGVAIMFYAPRN